MKLTFQFTNLSEFFWMEGYGPYVWAAYIITFAAIIGIAVSTVIAHKNFCKMQASIHKRKQAQANKAE